MSVTLYLILISSFSIEYIANEIGLPGLVKYFPDALSAGLLVFLVLRIATKKRIDMPPKYILLFCFFFLHALAGLILNDVSGAPALVGIRYYLRFVPLFLLPAVFVFSDKQLKGHIAVLFALGLLQLPISLFQRFVQFSSLSGDDITGSLESSAILTIYSVCCLLVLLGFYLKKKMSGNMSVVLGILLFLPCVLNETKATVVFMVVGLVAVVVFSIDTKLEFRKLLEVFIAFGLFLVIFTVAYNVLYSKPGGFLRYFSDDRATAYLYKESTIDEDILQKQTANSALLGKAYVEKVELRRIDSIIAAFTILSKEPFKLYFGLGMGNVAAFNYSSFEGEYASLSSMLRVEDQTFTLLIWELGIGGALIYLIFLIMVLLDMRKLAMTNGFTGTLAVGWLGVVAVIALSLFYANVFQFGSIGYTFFYVSGSLLASRTRIRTTTSRICLVQNYSSKPLLATDA